jgi:integrase
MPAKPAHQTKIKITKEFAARITATGERQTYRDTECRGLLLRVGATGKKSWALDYRDPQGKRQTYTMGDADRIDPGEARKKAKALGEDPAGDKREKKLDAAKADSRTVRKFVEGRYFKDYLERETKSGEVTKKRILSTWEPLLDKDMASLEVEDAIQHRLDRLDDEVTPQTLNRDRTALLAMLNKAVEWKIIDKNPLDDPAFKPLDTADDKRVRWLGQRDEHESITDEYGEKIGERARFMAAIEHEGTPGYLHDLAVLAMNTGLRRGELFKLRWENVSTARAELLVRASTAKSNKMRHLALNTVAMAVLTRMSKVRHISGFVFVNPEGDARRAGKPFTTVKKAWATVVKRAQLDDFTFHDLRHDFASRLVQAGVNLYEVRDLLGHSSITLTERYAHLAPHQKRAAVAVLEAAA